MDHLSLSVSQDLLSSLSHSAGEIAATEEMWAPLTARGYRMEAVLGSGSFGTVASAVRVLDGARVAAKRVVVPNDVRGAKVRGFAPCPALDIPPPPQLVLREMALLARVHHVNVLSALDLCGSVDGAMFLITQCMDTDLAQVIDSDQLLLPLHVAHFTYCILRGLRYLHSCGIVHRDLVRHSTPLGLSHLIPALALRNLPTSSWTSRVSCASPIWAWRDC